MSMKSYSWIFVSAGLLSALAFAQGACGGSSSNGGGGATTTTSHTTSHTTTSGSTITTGTGGAMACTDFVDDTQPCGGCLASKCCSAVAACGNDTDCLDCASGNGDPTACAANALYTAFTGCEDSSCKTECTPTSDCNPVTNSGCTTAGDGCDLNQDGTYKCFGDATEALCAACSYVSGAEKYCAPTMYCIADQTTQMGKCARYCCTDADCGTGKCDTSTFPGGVGICMAGGDAGAMEPSCDAPATPPSGGSCFSATG
jgi:hypothetical protein